MDVIVKIEMIKDQNGDPLGIKPKKAHINDAAFDIYAAKGTILPGHRSVRLIKTGFKLEIPEGWKANILPRSGLSLKKRIIIANSPGTIDAGYRDEVCVIMLNLSDEPVYIEYGDRIAQMDFQRVYKTSLEEVESVSKERDRGGGFGSTGI